MTDFTAARLERLAASAYDLVANAFLHEPSAAGFQGQKLEPVCTEPFCGGFFWHKGRSWSPEEAPSLAAMPRRGAGNHDPLFDPDLVAPKPKKPHELISDYLASKPLDKLDLTGARIYLPLDKPIATRVKLIPANKDEWQWWMADHATKVMIGLNEKGVVDFEEGRRNRDAVMEHLTPFLRMDDDVMVAGKKIMKGSELLTIKPFRKPLRVAPWIGSQEQIRNDKFPLELTFGMPKKPMEEYSGGKGGPPDYRQLKEPQILNVKRLDVVLQKPRQGFKDFLHTSREPSLGMREEDM